MDIGIDLGTATLQIVVVGKGIVLEEPSVVAIDHRSERILSVGQKAYEMIGRTPGYISAIRPLRDGVICDYRITEAMIQHVLRQVCTDRFIKPRLTLCVPSGITDVESRAVVDAALSAGARQVCLLEEPVAAALGAGLDLNRPEGHLIVDIGGGTADIAVLSLNGIVYKTSVAVAGDACNEAIIRCLRSQKGLLIGERMAEELKRQIGAVDLEGLENLEAQAKGRSLESGLPAAVTVDRQLLYEPLLREAMAIVDGVRLVLEHTPPELVGDLTKNGILLTGGGCLLEGLDRLIQRHSLLPVQRAEDPVRCVVLGCGRAFSCMDQLSDGFFAPSIKNF